MSSEAIYLPKQGEHMCSSLKPTLSYVCKSDYSSDWDGKQHTHPCTELVFITGGHGLFQMEDQEFPVAMNDVVAVNCGVPHLVTGQADNPLRYVVLGVEGMVVRADIGGGTMIHLHQQPRQITALLGVLTQEARLQEEGWPAVCGNLLEVLLRLLVRREHFAISGQPEPGGEKSCRECERVRQYIDNHFKESIRLDDLAELAHINKYYLSHAFQREYGVSPISYLLSRRIQESCYLLTTTNHSLSQIAEMLGFSSLSYFSQSFRRSRNVSPLEYRRSHRRAMAELENL